MEYIEFETAVLRYNELYRQGLKKQANDSIATVMSQVNALDDADKCALLRRFVSLLCDSHAYEFLQKRGNGKLPYALEQSVKDWLLDCCRMEQMPEMRWFYELFSNDRVYFEQAHQYLQKAYRHAACDDKTVALLFRSHVATLHYGAHHFPDGCVISNEAMHAAFDECRQILAEKPVESALQQQLAYLQALYDCFDRYCRDGKSGDFDAYCQDAGITFSACPSFFY